MESLSKSVLGTDAGNLLSKTANGDMLAAKADEAAKKKAEKIKEEAKREGESAEQEAIEQAATGEINKEAFSIEKNASVQTEIGSEFAWPPQ